MSRDLPGVNPATLNGMLLYYRLMTKWCGLGDSTELSRVGLSQHSSVQNQVLPSYNYVLCISSIEETSDHLLLNCTFVRTGWSSLDLNITPGDPFDVLLSLRN
jgi:hypothetical protein